MSTRATLFRQFPKPVPILPLLLAVPMVLASAGPDLKSLGPGILSGSPDPAPTIKVAPPVKAAALFSPWAEVEKGANRSDTLAPRDEPPKPGQDLTVEAALLQTSLPQQPAAEALGSITASGEVALNGTRVPQTATLYSNDTIRTGRDGNATVKFPGKGDITISPETLIRFSNSSRYVAQLEYGYITRHVLGQVKGFQVRIGNFVVVSDPGSDEASTEVERPAGGPIRIKAIQGSVGVIELDGPQTSFIRTGQELSISVDGQITGGGASQPPPSAPQPTPARGGGGHKTAILLGVGGGAAAAAGAAVALSGNGKAQPVSPSAP